MPLKEAISLISLKHRVDPTNAPQITRHIKKVLRAIPKKIREQCSARVVRSGRFLSINAGNHLLYRFPAYADDGRRIDADCLLIWPKSRRPSILTPQAWKPYTKGGFHAIDAVNIDVDVLDVLKLNRADWKAFARACSDAITVRRTRNWASNVDLGSL
jgi:hypothetical protein